MCVGLNKIRKAAFEKIRGAKSNDGAEIMVDLMQQARI
jgi:hypothetical protein